MSVEELLKKMQGEKERAYRVYREAELTENETELAHIDGILEGMGMMIQLVEEHIK